MIKANTIAVTRHKASSEGARYLLEKQNKKTQRLIIRVLLSPFTDHVGAYKNQIKRSGFV